MNTPLKAEEAKGIKVNVDQLKGITFPESQFSRPEMVIPNRGISGKEDMSS